MFEEYFDGEMDGTFENFIGKANLSDKSELIPILKRCWNAAIESCMDTVARCEGVYFGIDEYLVKEEE